MGCTMRTRATGLVVCWLLASVALPTTFGENTTDTSAATTVFEKFSSFEKKMLALQATDFIKQIIVGVEQHFGVTNASTTNLASAKAAIVAGNTATSMLLTSLNESLSLFLPSNDQGITVTSSTPSRRLQDASDADDEDWDPSSAGGISIIYVSSLDNYQYDGDVDDDIDDMMNPWGNFGFMGGQGSSFESMMMPAAIMSSGGLLGSTQGSDDEDAALAAAFSALAHDYGVDTLGLLSQSGASAASHVKQPAVESVAATHSTATSDDDTDKLPQFAVFGPQRGSQNEGGTVIVTDLSTVPPAVAAHQAADAIVQPLSSAARTQIPHATSAPGGPTQVDARWWGIVVAIALGTLLCAVAFLTWSKSRGHRSTTEDRDHLSPGEQPRDPLLLSGTNPAADAYLHAVKAKESKIDIVPGQAARKVSNLPA